MNHVLRPAATLTALLLAVAPPANAAKSNGTVSPSPSVVTSSPATPSPGLAGLTQPATSSWTSWMSPWTPLPSRFDDGSWSALRVEWDPEAAAWGVATSLDVAAAGVFGARLPSDRPVQVTRADGTVMLLTGPEGMEYLSVHRGPDGRFHRLCGHDHETGAVPAAGWAEK